jgi:hypothetical protein
MKQYIVISLADTDKVIWSQVSQSSAQSMRRNIANTQGLLSYLVEPFFITNGSIIPIGDVMSHEECLALMQTPEWSPPEPPVE